MKKTISGLILATFLSSFAFAQSFEILKRDIRKKLFKLQRISHKMSNEIDYYSLEKLENLNFVLEDTIAKLLGNYDNFPYYKTSVIGSIGNFSFAYEVSGVHDFAVQCTNEFKNKINLIDEATLSVDFGELKTLKTSGWWHASGHVCAVLADKAKELGLSTYQRKKFSAVGSILKHSFIFTGDSLMDIHRQCVYFYNNDVKGLFDEVYVIANSKFLYEKKSNGWWKEDVCSVITSAFK